MNTARKTRRGVTLAELVTTLVVIAVLAAVAVPMWRNHQLRVQRADAIAALTAIQNEQDSYFGRHARYADASRLTVAAPDGLGLTSRSKRGYYRIELRSAADGLGYLATAKAEPQAGQSADSRCVEFTLDHNGRRHAVDASGEDRSADCWR